MPKKQPKEQQEPTVIPIVVHGLPMYDSDTDEPAGYSTYGIRDTTRGDVGLPVLYRDREIGRARHFENVELGGIECLRYTATLDFVPPTSPAARAAAASSPASAARCGSPGCSRGSSSC